MEKQIQEREEANSSAFGKIDQRIVGLIKKIDEIK